jgi:hypothetical protein
MAMGSNVRVADDKSNANAPGGVTEHIGVRGREDEPASFANAPARPGKR